MNIFKHYLLILVSVFSISLFITSCSDDSKDDIMVGHWIQDDWMKWNDNKYYDVHHIVLKEDNTFLYYVTFGGAADNRVYHGDWSFSSSTLKLKYSDGQVDKCKVKDGKFTYGDITFIKK